MLIKTYSTEVLDNYFFIPIVSMNSTVFNTPHKKFMANRSKSHGY